MGTYQYYFISLANFSFTWFFKLLSISPIFCSIIFFSRVAILCNLTTEGSFNPHFFQCLTSTSNSVSYNLLVILHTTMSLSSVSLSNSTGLFFYIFPFVNGNFSNTISPNKSFSILIIVINWVWIGITW